jgi:alpha-D-ribose 1-methylphosphonate 5-triphosphate synthase subunit PhnH
MIHVLNFEGQGMSCFNGVGISEQGCASVHGPKCHAHKWTGESEAYMRISASIHEMVEQGTNLCKIPRTCPDGD